jgi:hypothetical protein
LVHQDRGITSEPICGPIEHTDPEPGEQEERRYDRLGVVRAFRGHGIGEGDLQIKAAESAINRKEERKKANVKDTGYKKLPASEHVVRVVLSPEQ